MTVFAVRWIVEGRISRGGLDELKGECGRISLHSDHAACNRLLLPKK